MAVLGMLRLEVHELQVTLGYLAKPYIKKKKKRKKEETGERLHCVSEVFRR
jgi:hypothetical protein